MARANKFDVKNPAPILDDEDDETLAAIDEGIRGAEPGRVVPTEKVRQPLPIWTSNSSPTS
jgi:predicted transcriptional regulator